MKHGCEFRPGLYYDAEYQIWVRPEADGTVSVGMTDISQTIAGKVLHVRVRRPGSVRPKGKPVATVETGKWAGPVPNPFDCVIEAGNEQVLDDPTLLNRDPYEWWIARVRPTGPLPAALADLLTGDAAAAGFEARCQREDIHCKRVGTGEPPPRR
jgi:glycine cleavage system H protein